jgi:hypothetical protein
MLAITNSGAVKIWMLTGYENRVLIIYRNICTNITYKHHMNVFDKILAMGGIQIHNVSGDSTNG